jgi:hypothetical protein
MWRPSTTVGFVVKTAIALALVVVTPLPGQAQAVNDWVGKRVLPRSRDFQIRCDEKVGGQHGFEMGICRVMKVDGRKLWLATEEKKPRTGWVLSDQVVLLDESIPFVRDQIQAHPQVPFPFDKAIADYTEAIRLDPANASLRDFRGNAQYR